ncbi:MAG: hypothetical protein KF906_05535 [Actinobacteria bacterium]|nr:hypothetical protein [Actinomycetota bacterium]
MEPGGEVSGAPYLDERGNPRLAFDLGDELGHLVIGSTDWTAWQYPGRDIRVRIERDKTGQRFEITGIALLSHGQGLFGPAPVRVTELRDIPLVRLDAVLNNPRWNEALNAAREHGTRSGTDFSPAVDVERHPFTPRDMVPPPADDYEIPGAANTGSRPDDFYRQVAYAWAAAVAEGHRNAASVIAEANGVAVTTVHRWVREARRRQVMAPSKRDRDQDD